MSGAFREKEKKEKERKDDVTITFSHMRSSEKENKYENKIKEVDYDKGNLLETIHLDGSVH